MCVCGGGGIFIFTSKSTVSSPVCGRPGGCRAVCSARGATPCCARGSPRWVCAAAGCPRTSSGWPSPHPSVLQRCPPRKTTQNTNLCAKSRPRIKIQNIYSVWIKLRIIFSFFLFVSFFCEDRKIFFIVDQNKEIGFNIHQNKVFSVDRNKERQGTQKAQETVDVSCVLQEHLGPIHTGRGTRCATTQANGTCCCQWRCPHYMQATSKEKCLNLRTRGVPRPVWIGPCFNSPNKSM